MSSKLLLPNKYKLIGWLLLIPATILGVVLTIIGFDAIPFKVRVFSIIDDGLLGKAQLFGLTEENITITIVGICFIAGAVLVGFSKEKREDEFIEKLRLSSLLWAVWVSYILLFLAFIFVYGMAFFNVMVYNMFTVLIIFIVRFNYNLYKNSKTVSDEK